MENNIEKQGWSWLGFFFAPYYYAGYGDLVKGIVFAILYAIPFIALFVGIYAGLKAKKELPIKQQEFKWANVGIVAIINIVFIATIQIVLS